MKTFINILALTLSMIGFVNASYNYQYIASKSQKGATCGYYALANAHAVQQLFNENKAINAKNIESLTEQTLTNYFTPFFEEEFNQLPDEFKKQYGTVLGYAEIQADLLDFDKTVLRETVDCQFFTMLSNNQNKLNDAYAIQYVSQERSKNPLFIVGSNNADVYGAALQNIKHANKKIVHFLYNLGSDKSGHWVYIGVIKQANQRPYIVHLNSTNTNSYETSQEFRLILQHIINCIDNGQLLMNQDAHAQGQTQEDRDLEKAIQASLQDQQSSARNMQEEQDHAYAKQLQEKEDLQYAQRLQEQENKDFVYAKQLQEQEDSDYAFALALAQEDN